MKKICLITSCCVASMALMGFNSLALADDPPRKVRANEPMTLDGVPPTPIATSQMKTVANSPRRLLTPAEKFRACMRRAYISGAIPNYEDLFYPGGYGYDGDVRNAWLKNYNQWRQRCARQAGYYPRG